MTAVESRNRYLHKHMHCAYSCPARNAHYLAAVIKLGRTSMVVRTLFLGLIVVVNLPDGAVYDEQRDWWTVTGEEVSRGETEGSVGGSNTSSRQGTESDSRVQPSLAKRRAKAAGL